MPQTSRKDLQKQIDIFKNYKLAYPRRIADIDKFNNNIKKITAFMDSNFPEKK